tara:strand:+ start:1684 stop:1827 length:144 start_codon:yes stop_codon:yes gene_type:complete
LIKEQQKLTNLPSDNFLMSLKIAQQMQGQSENADSKEQSSSDENDKK